MKFMGNAPPVLCIAARETDHALLSNQLKAKKKGSGLRALGTAQVLSKWKGLQARQAILALDRQRRTSRRQNQYSSKRASIIRKVAKNVRTVQLKQSRKRTESYRHGGSGFIDWMNAQKRLLHPGRMSVQEHDQFRQAQGTRHNLQF